MVITVNNSFVINKEKLKFDLKRKKKINIKSYPENYNVIFNDSFNNVKKIIKRKNSYCIIDKHIFLKYFNVFKNLPEGNFLLINATEKNKSDLYIRKILNFFVKKNISKSDIVYCFGGGIIQDLCGYSCCTFKRGIRWVYYPTTFLGMTDSCVGGKVGVNYKNFKNLIALFTAPKEVVINLNFLKTLKINDFFSGLGEALRLHITGGKFFYKRFDKNFKGCVKKNNMSIYEMIYYSLMVKKSVVEKDEYEKDIRRAMNFGHSFGHAFEYISKNKIPHGLCVVIGMCVEILVGQKKKIIKNRKMIKDILDMALPIICQKKIIDILKKTNLAKINDAFLKDKKTLDNKIYVALPYDYGKINFFPLRLNHKTRIIFQDSMRQLIKILNEQNSLN